VPGYDIVAESIRTGAPAEFYTNARPAGPLATFGMRPGMPTRKSTTATTV
jgi:hypothetical protein